MPPAERSFERVSGVDPLPMRRGRVEATLFVVLVSAPISGAMPERRETTIVVRMWDGRSMGVSKGPAQDTPAPLSRKAVQGEPRRSPGALKSFNYFERPRKTPCLTPQKDTTMKKNTPSKPSISLGDLVASVSSYARNEREMVAAIADLFRRGDVVAKTRHGTKRLKLA